VNGRRPIASEEGVEQPTHFDGDVHVGAEPRDTVEDGGLGAEQEPAEAGPRQRALEVGEEVSDRLGGRGSAGRLDRARDLC
jgi:hypothetical protein